MKKILFAYGLLAWAGVCAATTPLPDYSPVASGQHVVINIPQLRLFLYENGELKASYPVAVGRARTRTPLGDYQIGAKAYNPTWTIPASIRRERAAAGKPALSSVPPGPSNPLGPVFVRLGDPRLGLGIHGTNAPSSVPGVRSHGCVRMQSPDALRFARAVQTGADAAVIYQMASLNADEAGNLWLAAYKDPYNQRNLDTDALKQSIRAWADVKGLNVQANRVSTTLRNRNGRLVCITCSQANARVRGKLSSLAWQSGSADLSRPRAVFEEEAAPLEDQVLPEGSAVEALADMDEATARQVEAITGLTSRIIAPLLPQERPLEATPVPTEEALADALM
ncbi:MAG: L,D-transpeptidase [Eikenella sp.]|nr:L,D-transpeptidase [Eikenella sp.]